MSRPDSGPVLEHGTATQGIDGVTLTCARMLIGSPILGQPVLLTLPNRVERSQRCQRRQRLRPKAALYP